MYRSGGSQGHRTARSHPLHFSDVFKRLTEEPGFSRFDAGRQVESDPAPKSYIRLRPEPRYSADVGCGHADCLYSASSSRTLSTTYTTAEEQPAIKARIAQTAHRNKEEQKIEAEEQGARLASQLKWEQPLPQPKWAPLVEEPPVQGFWHQRPDCISALASRRSTWNTPTISGFEYVSPPSSSLSQAKPARISYTYRNHPLSEEKTPARMVDRTKSTSNRKGPTFIRRDANGNLQSERCLNGECRNR